MFLLFYSTFLFKEDGTSKHFFANDLNHLFWSAAHNEDSTQPFTFANKTYDLFGPVACKKDSPVKQPFIFAKDHQDEPAPCKEDSPVRQPLSLANHTESVLQIIWMDQPLQRRMALYSGQQHDALKSKVSFWILNSDDWPNSNVGKILQSNNSVRREKTRAVSL